MNSPPIIKAGIEWIPNSFNCNCTCLNSFVPAFDKAEKEVKAAQEKAQQAKEQAARAEAAHDKAEASAQAEAKRLADVAAALEAKAFRRIT